MPATGRAPSGGPAIGAPSSGLRRGAEDGEAGVDALPVPVPLPVARFCTGADGDGEPAGG
ncbi:hypothetical protein OG232_20155 [Streptomyces sp. NBC_01411]|uniref:hypothetical protein n=1 Tax=Streptomyces sp. NBC_01411 TaxID=2903857 RepID=UPI0032431CCD